MKATTKLWIVACAALVACALVSLEATFTALCGTGTSCAYISGDKFGYQTANQIRTNLNDHETRILAIEGTSVITSSSTNTFTNKTMNAESTGNILTLPFTVYWPAAICDQAAAYQPLWSSNGTGDPTYACVTGANVTYAELSFPDASSNQIFQTFRLPADWTSTLDLSIFWRSTATTGNVAWQIQTACVADGATVDPAWNTAQVLVDATQGTASRFNTATQSTLTTTGCSAGNLLNFRIIRDGTHVSDTIGAAALMLGAQLTYRRAI